MRSLARIMTLTCAAAAIAASTACAGSSKTPNIVWMFSNDHAYQAIGAYGGRLQNENLTPNIDSLARDGMRFDRAYVGNSICAPSRATLLTGKHSHLNGKFDNRFMYEESFRTPLLVRWPGVTKSGSVNSDLVQNIDFAETFLDLAGIAAPDDMQGESLVPLFKGKTPRKWRKSLYYHYYEYPGCHSVRRHEGVATDRYKLIRFYGKDVPNGEEWEFYDLKKDPSEMKSEYSNPEYAPVIKRHKKELQRLREHYQVPAEA